MEAHPRVEPPVPRGRLPEWGLGDFLWIWVVGVIAALVLGSIGFAITGDTSDHVGALTTAFSAFGQYFAWLGAIVFVAVHKGRSLRADFGLTWHPRDIWALGAGVGLVVVLGLLVLPLRHLADNQQQSVVHDLDTASGAKLAVLVIVAVLVAPVVEELLFRGLLQRALRRRLPTEWAIALAALAFAVVHPLLDPSLGTLSIVPALFGLGAISGIQAEQTGDLSRSIMLHMGFNAVAALSVATLVR